MNKKKSWEKVWTPGTPDRKKIPTRPGPAQPSRRGNQPKGIVVDNKAAKLTGTWNSGAGLAHIGSDYAYARGAGHTATFPFTVPTDGRYEVRFATAPHENRASNTAITVRHADGAAAITVNQKKPATIEKVWLSLGTFRFKAGQPFAVEVDATSANGNAHIDAVQVLPAK